PAPPLAAWRHDAPEDETPDGLADELADGREYRRGVSRAKTVDSAPAAVADDREGYDEEASYQQDAPRDARDDAWRDRWGEDDGDGTMSRSRGKWLPAISKRDKIQILAGAIAAMVIALIGLGLYFYLSRENDGVTLAIGVRREVSDAATAARIPTDKLAVVQTYAVFDGRDPTIFATTPDNPVRFDAQGGFARVSSSASAPGVKVTIGPGLAARLAGQRVRIVILARSSTELGAVAMRFAYQSGVAISHWQTASLAPEYEAAGMVWRVPTMRTSPSGDYLVIEPGIPGDGTGVDIKSIKIDMLADEGS
ncbi:MAG: hypothetical protein NUV72_01970, partial [Bauldia sp.]|nr:hypothetical protein [Bauldia sp.]